MKNYSTSSFRHLLVALLCLCGLTANAQYTVTTTQKPTTDYSNSGAQFSLTEICTALGTDTATFAAAYPSGDATFQAYDTDGNLTSSYTGNPGEFWLDNAGAVHAYSEAAWFIGASVDIENDVLYVYAGQMPSAFSDADTLTTKAVVAYGDKQVTFDITLMITAPLKNETTGVLSELTIVGEATADTLHQYPRTSYASDDVKIAIKDLTEKLGIAADDLYGQEASVMYATQQDAYGIAADTLTNESTATPAPGFWMAKSVDKATGAYSNELLTSYTYGDSCRIYVAGFALNEACDTLTASIGQYPGHVNAGESYKATFYAVWGQKAYKINYLLKVDQPTITSIEDMTMVGEQTDTVPGLYASASDYVLGTVTYDVAAIATQLGCDSTSMSFQALADETNFATGTTANNGGYWMNISGYVTSWGSTAIWYCEPVSMYDTTHPNFSSMNVGLYPGNCAEGDTIRGSLYIVDPDGTKYYKLNLVLPVGKQKTIAGVEIVKTFNAAIQLVVSSDAYIGTEGSNSYDNQTPYYITAEKAAELIGTSTPTFYTLYADSTWEVDGSHKYCKAGGEYPCTGTGTGTWLGKDGYAAGWGSSSPIGLMYAPTLGGLFYCFQYPGACTVGESYKTKGYLINDETLQAIEINFTIAFVSALEDVSEVGTFDETASLDETGGDKEFEFPIDEIATALGTDAATLMTSYCLKGKKSDGTFSEGVDPVNGGLMFNNDGTCNNEGGNIGLFFSEDGKTMSTYANNVEDLGDTYQVTATIAFDVVASSEAKGLNGTTDAVSGTTKRAIVNVIICDANTYTGISTVKVNVNVDGKIYNLNGQQVSKATRGIYIQNGKKYVVK